MAEEGTTPAEAERRRIVRLGKERVESVSASLCMR
jgi:hypothetical protein